MRAQVPKGGALIVGYSRGHAIPAAAAADAAGRHLERGHAAPDQGRARGGPEAASSRDSGRGAHAIAAGAGLLQLPLQEDEVALRRLRARSAALAAEVDDYGGLPLVAASAQDGRTARRKDL